MKDRVLTPRFWLHVALGVVLGIALTPFALLLLAAMAT